MSKNKKRKKNNERKKILLKTEKISFIFNLDALDMRK